MPVFLSAPPIIRVGKAPFLASLTYAGSATTVSIGDPSPDRIIVVGCSILAVSTNVVQTGMTIGGVTATRAGAVVGNQANVAIFYALVPSGSTAALTFAGGGAAIARVVGVYRLTGWINPSPLSVSFPAGGGSAGRGATLSSVDGAAAIGVSAGDTNGSSWSGGSQQYYIGDGQGLIHTGALGLNVPTPSVTLFNSNNRAMGGISWR